MEKHLELKEAIKRVAGDDVKITHLNVNEEDSLVTIAMVVPEGALSALHDEKMLKRSVIKVIKLDFGYTGVKLSVDVKKEAPVRSSHTKYIMVTSGKGGVGKSTTSANLAACLARFGHKVGIIDADFYGASIPKIFGMNDPQLRIDANEKIIPPQSEEGVMIMSTDFLVGDDQPLIWRGPMLGRMLEHLFKDVAWPEDTDYIIVDLPPGTSDIPLFLKDLIPEAKALVVTTPNQMASEIAIKSGEMAKTLGHQILGVVENMSYYINPANGNHDKIFGSGGGLAVAQRLETEVLAEISIGGVKEDKTGGIFAPHEENGLLYLGLANKVMKLF